MKSKDKNKILLWQKIPKLMTKKWPLPVIVRSEWLINCDDGKSRGPKAKHKFPKPDGRKIEIPSDSIVVEQRYQRRRDKYQKDADQKSRNEIAIHTS